jgi:hypothetical protein
VICIILKFPRNFVSTEGDFIGQFCFMLKKSSF